MPDLKNQRDLDHALTRLMDLDSVLVPYLDACRPVAIRQRDEGLSGLLQIILAQQVSVASARSIWERFNARYPDCNAAELATTREEDLQGCGLSRPKIRSVLAIAQALEEGFDLAGQAPLGSREVRANLTGLHGVGPWTADIYLLFCLGRSDIFPAGDLALQVAVQHVFSHANRPGETWLAEFAGKRWAPERSAAAHLFWAIYQQIKKGRSGVV